MTQNMSMKEVTTRRKMRTQCPVNQGKEIWQVSCLEQPYG